MTMLETLVEKTLRDPLTSARAFQEAGGRVIGYVGSEVPVELIIACQAMPLRIPRFCAADFPHADQYIESTFLPSIRSVAEQYLLGHLDFLDAIVLPRSNDSAQRLYYYLCELHRRELTHGPKVLIYDLAKVPRESSLAYSEQATHRLAETLGVHETSLPGAIALRNRRRELLSSANLARIHSNEMKGSFMDRVFSAADLCDANEFDAAFVDWLANNSEHSRVPGPRILLAGDVPPDERLHSAVEIGGGNVVAELGDFASAAVSLPLIDEKGGYAALAAHYHGLKIGPRAFVNRPASLLACAQKAKVHGVIQWLIEQEEALLWDLPAQEKVLSDTGIPALTLSRRCWDTSDGAGEEIVEFTRSLGDRT